MRQGIWLTITAIVAALAAGPSTARAECPIVMYAYRHGAVVFSEQGREARVRVEIADTPDRRDYGLMCRTTLDPDAGMLFTFSYNTQTQFWMKNTLIPLSIAFIDSDWHILRVMDMPVAPDPATPPPGAVYGPEKPYRYALEVNLGFFAQHGIDERAGVRFIPEESSGGPAELRSIAPHRPGGRPSAGAPEGEAPTPPFSAPGASMADHPPLPYKSPI